MAEGGDLKETEGERKKDDGREGGMGEGGRKEENEEG
jgi:hypothetical protein